MLTRMRQLALHPGLVPLNYLEQLQATEEEGDAPPAMRITPADRVRLQSQLAQIIEDCEVRRLIYPRLYADIPIPGMSDLLQHPFRSQDN